MPAQTRAGRMGLWLCRRSEQRGSYPREISRHQAGCGLPGVPRSHGERSALAFARCAGEYRNVDYRVLCDVAGIKRKWALFRPSRIAIFQPRQNRPRSGRRLQQTQGNERSRSRAMARAKPELRPCGITTVSLLQQPKTSAKLTENVSTARELRRILR